MLAAACAVGVAGTYGAPVGGTIRLVNPARFPYLFGFYFSSIFRRFVQYRSYFSIFSSSKLLERFFRDSLQCSNFSFVNCMV